MRNRKYNFLYRATSCFVAIVFTLTTLLPPGQSYAQLLNLPPLGTMVTVSPAYLPPIIKGITIHPENPLLFDFIVHPGDDNLQGEQLKEESTKLIKYFMASLTVPEDQMWVNLSPYEKDRIVPDSLGQTEMGRDLLAQDYLLKQLTASLMYPEDELGSEFWDRVYKKAYEKYGTSEIPMNTFNKVWIMPDTASIYENGTSVFVVDSHLKVMLEEDYMAMDFQQKSTAKSRAPARGVASIKMTSSRHPEDTERSEGAEGSQRSFAGAQDDAISSEIIREILIPEIEKEVNEGKTFANLRQIYNSVILATWYKQNLKESLLGQVYVDQNKTKGIDIEDKQIKEKIYKQYLEAFKVGVYDYIKEDYDPTTRATIPRKYFSGGVGLGEVQTTDGMPQGEKFLSGTFEVEVALEGLASSPLERNGEDDDARVTQLFREAAMVQLRQFEGLADYLDQSETDFDALLETGRLTPLGQGGLAEVYRDDEGNYYKISRTTDSESYPTGRVPVEIIMGNNQEAMREAQNLISLQSLGFDAQIPHFLNDLGFNKEGRFWFKFSGIQNGERIDSEIMKSFKPEERVGIFIKAAKILQRMHDQNLVHGDIKPRNIIVNLNREVMIIDFSTANTEGTIVRQATERFAPPQHISGNDRLSPKFDIYSLGVTMRYVLNGLVEGVFFEHLDDWNKSGLSELHRQMTHRHVEGRSPETMHEVVKRLEAIQAYFQTQDSQGDLAERNSSSPVTAVVSKEAVARGLTYEEAVAWRINKIFTGAKVPQGFWFNETTARNTIFAALDTITGFKKAREASNIRAMRDLYRKYVIGYQPRDRKKYKGGGQQAFFYEIGGLTGLMSHSRSFLDKKGSPAAVIRFVLPELIDLTNPDALDPLEVERSYWTDPENARYHIFLALDTIPGFKAAREAGNIKTMADLYRKYVIGYQPRDRKKYQYEGQSAFFYEVGGLSGLMADPRDFLDKTASPAAVIRFILPELIDLTNPDALDPLEVEKSYWTDPDNARYHIFLALDTIPGFEEAREANDIKTMADLYRKHVIGYQPKDRGKYKGGGQQAFFNEVGGLAGLMTHLRDFFAKKNSPAAVIRFVLPGLIDLTNPDALDPLEVERSYWTDPDNARYHIFLTLDKIPGFKEAREAGDIKTMAGLYRKHVIGYQPKDREKYKDGGQQTFFYEVGGLSGLMSHSRGFLDKKASPAAVIRFVLPELIDLTNPDALDPLEVDNGYWTDPDNARYHIFLALDTMPGFKEAREANDIKTMADLYRKHVIGYKPKDREKYKSGGQITFFYEVGGLSGLMARSRDFLDKKGSPSAVIRFAIEGLIDPDNPDALHPREVEHKHRPGTESASTNAASDRDASSPVGRKGEGREKGAPGRKRLMDVIKANADRLIGILGQDARRVNVWLDYFNEGRPVEIEKLSGGQVLVSAWEDLRASIIQYINAFGDDRTVFVETQAYIRERIRQRRGAASSPVGGIEGISTEVVIRLKDHFELLKSLIALRNKYSLESDIPNSEGALPEDMTEDDSMLMQSFFDEFTREVAALSTKSHQELLTFVGNLNDRFGIKIEVTGDYVHLDYEPIEGISPGVKDLYLSHERGEELNTLVLVKNRYLRARRNLESILSGENDDPLLQVARRLLDVASEISEFLNLGLEINQEGKNPIIKNGIEALTKTRKKLVTTIKRMSHELGVSIKITGEYVHRADESPGNTASSPVGARAGEEIRRVLDSLEGLKIQDKAERDYHIRIKRPSESSHFQHYEIELFRQNKQDSVGWIEFIVGEDDEGLRLVLINAGFENDYQRQNILSNLLSLIKNRLEEIGAISSFRGHHITNIRSLKLILGELKGRVPHDAEYLELDVKRRAAELRYQTLLEKQSDDRDSLVNTRLEYIDTLRTLIHFIFSSIAGVDEGYLEFSPKTFNEIPLVKVWNNIGFSDVRLSMGSDKRIFIEWSSSNETETGDESAGNTPASSPVNKGGIDLNPEMIEMDRQGNGVKYQFPVINLQHLQNINIEGFLPVIINISPITDIPLLLGIADTEEEPTDLGYESLDPLEKRDRFKVVAGRG